MPSEASACVVGPNTQIVGQIGGEGDVVVEGRVQGGLRLAGHLLLSAGGLVEADVQAHRATLRGRLNGPLTVSEHLEVDDGAELSGTVQAETLSLAAGARVHSQIDMPLALPEAMH